MQTIHPTAIIDAAAQLGSGVTIGAYSVVGPHVTLGDGVKLHSHVVIDGYTTVGAGCEVWSFAVLGATPQHTRYDGEPSELHIGANCVIREHVTMHPGTAIGAMQTIVGNNGLFFAGAHVAHDCVVGDHVIFANNAALGGHVEIGDHVMLGGFAAVQQWCRVGAHAMVGAHSLVDADVMPFTIAAGNRATLSGINVIGLERRGFSPEIIAGLRDLFRNLIRGNGLFATRLAAVQERFSGTAEYDAVFEFIKTAGRNGVCQTYKRP
ncbi:MAG: acyl-ACP--UDP-N-acetylglucosamine O-acyltransferase [Candidatus Puniceispirillaceae bacterium]|jgi:UDP-N-acetylglucosamine acyltransferase|nr:acyl-ACP--UDP-N-acetylglucosamine O-acyltransferase [Alphaproteobacteria bacterium]